MALKSRLLIETENEHVKVKLERDPSGRVIKEWQNDHWIQGQYEDIEIGLNYNRFRYYSPVDGIYSQQDPIGLAGNNPTLYGYVKDPNTIVDIWGLSGELVYQLLDKKGNVIYCGITSRDALIRIAEHVNAGEIFFNIEVLAENLTHDQARSIEGALIRKRLRENIDKFKIDDSIMKRLDKSDLLNKNRGRVKERWISDNPLKDLKDKMYDKPKKIKCKG